MVVPVLVLAPALLLLPSALGGGTAEADLPATGDYAALELYTRQAAHLQQLLGPYSRFGFHHPGPAYFYASVPLYLASGERFVGIVASAFVVNAACAVLILWRAAREGGRAGLLAAGLVLALFVASRGPGWLFSAWNPNVAVLPFGLALMSWTAVAAGRGGALPLAVIASSFAAQSHVGCLPASAAIALAALALRVPALRRRAGLPPAPALPRRWVVVSVAALVLLWTPPLVEQLRPDGGNLAHIVGFARYSADVHAPREALQAAGTAIVGWVFGAREGSAIAALLALVAVLATAHGLARRAGDAFSGALALVTFAGVAAALLSAARVAGPLLPYLLRWMAMLALGAAVSLAVALSPWVGPALARRRRPRLAATTALVALSVVCGRNLALAREAAQKPPSAAGASESAARLAAAIAPELLRTSRRAVVEVRPQTDRDLVLGVVLALDKAGVRLAVVPFGPFRFGGRWRVDGTEDSRLVLGPADPALAARPGVRAVGREAGLFAYVMR